MFHIYRHFPRHILVEGKDALKQQHPERYWFPPDDEEGKDRVERG